MFISLDLNDGKDADETESVGMLDSTRSTSSNSSSSPHPADHRHQPAKGPKSHHTAAIHRTLAEAGAFSSYVNVSLSKLNSQRLKETVDHLMHSSRGGKGGGGTKSTGSPVAQLINRLVSSTNSFSLYSEMILAYHPPPLSNAASSRTAWREPPLGEGGYISLYRLPKVDTSGPSPVFAAPCQPHDEVFRRSLTSLRDVKAQDVGRQGMVVFRYLPPGKPTSWNDSSSAPAAVRFTTRRSAASMVSASSTASLDESLNEFPTSALGNDGEERSDEATAPSSPTSAGGGGRRSGALLRRFSVYRPPLSCFGSIGMSLSFDPTRVTDPDVETGYGGVDGTQRDKQAYNHLDIRFASSEDREVWVRLLKQLVGAAALEDLRNEGVVGGGTGESGGNVRAQVDALLSTAPNIDEYVEYFSSKVVDMVSVSAEGKVTVVDPKKPPANGVLNILFRNGTFKKKRKLWLNEESTLLYIGPESLRQRIRGVPIAELPLRTLSISAQSDEWGNTFFLNQHAEDAAEGSAPYRKLEFSCTSFVERIPWLLWFQKILGKPAEFEESIKRLAQDAAAMQAELEEQEGAVDCHTSFSLPKSHRNMLGHDVQNASFRIATPNRSNNISGRGMQSELGGPVVRSNSGLPLASREGLLPPLRPLFGSTAAEGGGGVPLTASPSIAFTSSRYFDSEGGSDLDPDEEEGLANDDMGNDERLHEGEAHQHEVPNNEEEEDDDTETYEFVGRPEDDEQPLIPLAAQLSWSAVDHRHEAAAKDVPLPPPAPSQANHPNRAETTVLDPVENWPMMEVSSNPLGDPTTPATPPRGGDDNVQRRQRDISEGEEEEAQTPDSGLRRSTSDHHSSATARLSSTDDNVADGSHFTMSTTTEPNTSTTSPASAAAAATAGLQNPSLRRNGSWSAIIQSLKISGGSGGVVAANGAPPALTDNNNNHNNDEDDDDVLSNLSVSFASRSVMLRLADLEEQLAKSTSQANSKTVLTQESDPPLPIQPPPAPDGSLGTGMQQSAIVTSAPPPPPPPSAAPLTIAPSSSSSSPRSIRPTAAPPLVFEDAHMTWCGWVLLFDPIDEQWQKIRLAIMDSPHAPFNPLRIGQVPVLRQLAESWGCGCSETSWMLCTSHLRRVRAVQRSVCRSDPLFFASTAARTGASPHPSDGSLFTPPQRNSSTRRTSAFSSSSDHLETTVVVAELHFDLDQWADEAISLLEHRLDRDTVAGGSLDYQVPRALAGSIQLHEPLQLVVLSGLSSKSLVIHDEGTLKLCKEVLPFL